MIVSIIYACINISIFRGLKKLDPNNNNIEIARKLNLSYVILFFSCFPIIILFICLYEKIKDISCCCNKIKENKNIDTNSNKSAENKRDIHNETETNINK